MKVRFKPGPKASSFDGFDGMKRTCERYSLKRISGHGQASKALRCVKYKKGAGKPPCKGGGRKVKGRSPGLLRGSLKSGNPGCRKGKG